MFINCNLKENLPLHKKKIEKELKLNMRLKMYK